MTDLAGRTSASAAIEVTDGAGRYRAHLQVASIVPPGQPQPPTMLSQQDLNSNRITIWPVNPVTGEIAGPPKDTIYESSPQKIGPGQPGTMTTPPPMPGPKVEP